MLYSVYTLYLFILAENCQSHDLTRKITQIRRQALVLQSCVPSCQRLRYEVNPTFRNSRSAIRSRVIDSSDQISCWRRGLETMWNVFHMVWYHS